MTKELKNALDTARAAYDFLKRQHATAEANKDAIIARRPALHQALNSAAERLEAAQVGNMRGVIADSDVASARVEHQAARDALVRQNEDEELALRAMNMADEFDEVRQAIVVARADYFGAIFGSIEKLLRDDKKLRSRIIGCFVASACMSGCDPDVPSGLDSNVQWGVFLAGLIPLPATEEVQNGAAEFAKTYDVGPA